MREQAQQGVSPDEPDCNDDEARYVVHWSHVVFWLSNSCRGPNPLRWFLRNKWISAKCNKC